MADSASDARGVGRRLAQVAREGGLVAVTQRFPSFATWRHFSFDLMRQFFYIAAFWVVVVVTIRLAVCFPRSLLARVYFSEFGPAPIRGETKSHYLLRCVRFAGGWFIQASILFVVGWIALGWQASLADSLYFLVLWAVIIPVLGSVALLGSLWAFARLLWIRRFGGARSTQTTQA